VPTDAALAAARICAAGRAAWPGVELAETAVAGEIAARLEADPQVQLDGLRDGELYLAMALAAKDAAALRVFEDVLVPEIRDALRRLRLAGGTADEVVQAMRVELLADGRVADYAGRGELAAWVRVSATRKAFKLIKKANREETLDEILLDHWPAPTPDPVGQHVRSTYTTELKRAIGEAFAALEVRQRNLLRQHIIDELTIDDLAKLYRVHRATCARWLADARAELGKLTRKRLVSALEVPATDLESLLRFLDSDIELSISRILQAR
jgi:RNA polymerase sigma-70 factor (ECF subfamily)